MRGFGDLEAVIMARLWSWDGPATVRDVVEDLRREREIAYTTVMTVMDNLHSKGWLVREMRGRAYEYLPVASREEYSAPGRLIESSGVQGQPVGRTAPA